MTRISIISRTPAVQRQFVDELEGIAHVDAYDTYDEAMSYLHGSEPPDCLVVHIQGLPMYARNGTPFVHFRRWLRRTRLDTPTIYLRRKGARWSTIRAAETVTLPIPPGAVRHLLRPYLPVQRETDAVTVDLKLHRASVGEQSVRLTRIESHLLAYFQSRRGEIATPDELMIDVWGYEPVASDTLVRAHISNLRRKLETIGIPRDDALQTVRAQGYRWQGIRPAIEERAA